MKRNEYNDYKEQLFDLWGWPVLMVTVVDLRGSLDRSLVSYAKPE